MQLAREQASLFLHPGLDLPPEGAAVGKLRARLLGLLTDAHELFHGSRHTVEAFSDLARLASVQQRQAGIERTLLDAGKRVGDSLEGGNRATGEPEDRDVGQDQKHAADHCESIQIIPRIENRARRVRRHAQRCAMQRDRQGIRRRGHQPCEPSGRVASRLVRRRRRAVEGGTIGGNQFDLVGADAPEAHEECPEPRRIGASVELGDAIQKHAGHAARSFHFFGDRAARVVDLYDDKGANEQEHERSDRDIDLQSQAHGTRSPRRVGTTSARYEGPAHPRSKFMIFMSVGAQL